MALQIRKRILKSAALVEQSVFKRPKFVGKLLRDYYDKNIAKSSRQYTLVILAYLVIIGTVSHVNNYFNLTNAARPRPSA